ncbi:CocE/NonD family hydrolase [Streptacidiphilus sp. N1-10]|uniref:CocE/NonD family hydrolase n=1 Tax=Streptacidiphilus jeojiensis TaxID=3229225 RepID=A0ABV6XGB8_9ACTN
MHHPHWDTDTRTELRTDLEATMRDGTVLRADAYRPTGGGPWPVLLVRTPYGKQDPGVLARLDPFTAARRGYLVVVQDCRGRFRSEGDWRPLAHESADGYDSIAWAARLPGADGRVGMYGPSYLGHTQWAAIAADPPQLHAAAPELTWSDPQDGLLARGGAVELGLVTHWTLTLGADVLQRRHADDPEQLRRQLALLDRALDRLTTHTYWELPVPASATMRRLGLPVPAAPLRETNGSPPPGVPTLAVAGWFDCFLQGSLDNYMTARRTGVEAALIVGPWSHDNQSGRIGDTDFAPTADAAGIDGGGSLLERELDWFDRQFKQQQAVPEPSSVLLFVMGVNQWRRLESWPPESVDTVWYLNAGGRLSLDPPGPPGPHSSSDSWQHDPTDPVPTCGGAVLMAPGFPAGPLDQRQIEKRDDVLVYTSEPLEAPLEVVGRVSVHLVTDSSSPSTDWVARLCDLDADGTSRNITDGILRDHQTRPDADLSIDLWSTAHVFLPGHRIRLQITSSCFPRWDRMPATSVARRTVHHDAARLSRIVLPVFRH